MIFSSKKSHTFSLRGSLELELSQYNLYLSWIWALLWFFSLIQFTTGSNILKAESRLFLQAKIVLELLFSAFLPCLMSSLASSLGIGSISLLSCHHPQSFLGEGLECHGFSFSSPTPLQVFLSWKSVVSLKVSLSSSSLPLFLWSYPSS